MTDWQPIETAPKDGSAISVIGGEYISEAANKKPLNFPLTVQYAPDGGGYSGCLWSHAIDHYYGIGCCPTHWMPLPKPPQ